MVAREHLRLNTHLLTAFRYKRLYLGAVVVSSRLVELAQVVQQVVFALDTLHQVSHLNVGDDEVKR